MAEVKLRTQVQLEAIFAHLLHKELAAAAILNPLSYHQMPTFSIS